MEQTKIDRINALTRLARERALTPGETAERETLRAEYRAAIRQSLEGHLDRVYLVGKDGSEEKLQKKERP